jgi:hypothetical protein
MTWWFDFNGSLQSLIVKLQQKNGHMGKWSALDSNPVAGI